MDPENYKLLNDLGFTLMKAGDFEEAEKVLKKAQSLAPPNFELPSNNLKELYNRKRKV